MNCKLIQIDARTADNMAAFRRAEEEVAATVGAPCALACEHAGCAATTNVADYVRLESDLVEDEEDGPWSSAERDEWRNEAIALCPTHAGERKRYSSEIQHASVLEIPGETASTRISWKATISELQERLAPVGGLGAIMLSHAFADQFFMFFKEGQDNLCVAPVPADKRYTTGVLLGVPIIIDHQSKGLWYVPLTITEWEAAAPLLTSPLHSER